MNNDKPISAKVRARYANREYPACTTTDNFKRAKNGLIWVEAVCKACGRTAWFRAEALHRAKSCGCKNNRGDLPDEFRIKRMTEKYKGQVIFDWEFIECVSIIGTSGGFRCLVRCTQSGRKKVMTFNAWRFKRYRKTYYEKKVNESTLTKEQRQKEREQKTKERIERIYKTKRWDLEHIWSNVVKAGREALGA